MWTFVLLSDTHGKHENLNLPPGDFLLHAGDFSQRGHWEELERFNDWLGRQPHRHKIVVAGNHDWCFERAPEEARQRLTNAVYLQDELLEIDGVRIYGTPWQPEFMSWAFNLPRGEPLRQMWAKIPEKLDVLITHGPPKGIGDRMFLGKRVGCADLRQRVLEVRPRLHLFGHIHEARGQWVEEGVQFINASNPRGKREPFIWTLEVPENRRPEDPGLETSQADS